MRFLLVSIPLSMCIHSACAAQDGSDQSIHGTVYAGPIVAPDYVGSDDYRIMPFGGFHLQYDRFFLRSEGSGLVANISPIDRIVLGPAGNFRIGRRPKDIDSEAVGALGKVDDAWEVGGFAGLVFPEVIQNGDSLEIGAKALFDVSDVHDGYTIQPSISYLVRPAPGASLGATVSATYGDGAYQNRYFGIDTEAAAVSGLAAYEAEGGFYEVRASFNGTYYLGGGWGLIGLAGYSRLVGDAEKSPIVSSEGDSNQFFGSLGVSFSF